MKSRLQRVSSEAGAGSTHGCGRCWQEPVPTSLPHLQVVEELAQCSHSIYDFQGALDGILSELVQHGQQAHEDKRFAERLYQNPREGFAGLGLISGPSCVAGAGTPSPSLPPVASCLLPCPCFTASSSSSAAWRRCSSYTSSSGRPGIVRVSPGVHLGGVPALTWGENKLFPCWFLSRASNPGE